MSKRLNSEMEGCSDHELLERFLREQNAQAFAALVERHGPMIMGVCRRMLRDSADADDAFQATFLMLLRKAHTIRHKTALPSWLYRVAVRIAMRQRQRAQKHLARTSLPDVAMVNDPADEVAWREAVEVIDGELQSLPENYRAPLLMCCIEGRSYEEAAAALGCPIGTLGIRLMRGREKLRKRLAQRGLLLGAGFLAAKAFWPQAQAQVPPELAANTVAAGKALLLGQMQAGAIKHNVMRMLGRNSKWWQFAPRLPVLPLVLGTMCLLVGIFVVVTHERTSHGATWVQAPANKASPALPNPVPEPFQLRRPKPGLWVARKKGDEVAWAYAGNSAQAVKEAQRLGPPAEGEIVEVAIITDKLRFVPQLQRHEGVIYWKNFSSFNGFFGI